MQRCGKLHLYSVSWFNVIMIKYFLFILLSLTLAACSSVRRFTSERNIIEKKKSAEAAPVPATENDLNIYDELKPVETFNGTASYYADEFNGRKTSNGEIYNMNAMTAAQPDLPFNSIVRVINTDNRKSVLLRINDRGPIKKGRIIDVSYAAARKLGMISNGTANVKVEVLRLGEK